VAHPFTWECPTGRNLTKIRFKIFALRAKIRACAYGTLIISARFAWKVKGHASRGNYSKLNFKIIQKFLLGCAGGAPFHLGVPYGQKSFKIYTKSNKIGTLRVEIIQN